MPFKSASSTIALTAAAAFALSSAAMAQTMVGDQEISEADMPMVEAHCATLTGDAAADTTETDDMATDDMAADTDSELDAGGATMDDDAETDDMAADDTMEEDMVDLDAITAEDCETAGLAAE